MGLMDQIKQDIAQITASSDEFAVSVTFTSPGTSPVFATVNAIAVAHHLSVGSDGLPTNAKNAHVTFSEQVLSATGYPVRNSVGEVALNKHKVNWTDSAGRSLTYVIREAYPDETIGLILCILGDFN